MRKKNTDSSNQTPGNIILLNGTSSSGKTTIAKALQAILTEPYYLFGMDMLQSGFPPGVFVFNEQPSAAGVDGWEILIRSERLSAVRPGRGAIQFLRGLYRAVAGFASAGNHMIVDDVIYAPSILRVVVEELHDLPVLFVGVRLPLEIAEKREKERGDRLLGGARAFFDGAHDQKVYDLELDNANLNPQECAQRIKEALKNGCPGTAMQELSRRML
jgi:chloramphenicol 3-O phosphotransferase